MNDFRIIFEFRNERDEWVWACLDNNGEGYTKEDALKIMNDLKNDEVCAKRHICAEFIGA